MANKNFGKIALGAGTLTYNDGATDIDLGYVRAGVFNDNLEEREIEVNGKRTRIKGDSVMETCKPTLEFAVVQMESDIVGKVFANLEVTDAAGIKTIKRKLGHVTDDQYLDNVMYVGKTLEGKDITIKLINVIGTGPITLPLENVDEVEIPALFTASNLSVADEYAPFELILDETV